MRATRGFLWGLIHNREQSERGFHLLTGERLSTAWGRRKADRHLRTSSAAALKGYYHMWLESDFSPAFLKAEIAIPFLVIGGRQDLPGFQEPHLRRTLGTWLPRVESAFIADAGHYPMQETPVLLASLIERFLHKHR